MPDLFHLENCRLDFYCAQDWDSLIETDDNKTRLCLVCKEYVRYCETQEEFDESSQAGICVAIKTFTHEDIEKLRQQEWSVTLGIPKREK